MNFNFSYVFVWGFSFTAHYEKTNVLKQVLENKGVVINQESS